MPTITDKLNQLSELQSALDMAALEKQRLIDQVLTPEIKQQLADIEAEFSENVAAVNEKISDLEGEIKAEVIAGGSTVKGAHLQAVYTRGRVSWDSAKLDGLMILLPQLKEARKEGAPSVSIRRIG